MKITKRQLRRIIKEEKQKLLKESTDLMILADEIATFLIDFGVIDPKIDKFGVPEADVEKLAADYLKNVLVPFLESDDIGNQLDEDDEYSW